MAEIPKQLLHKYIFVLLFVVTTDKNYGFYFEVAAAGKASGVSCMFHMSVHKKIPSYMAYINWIYYLCNNNNLLKVVQLGVVTHKIILILVLVFFLCLFKFLITKSNVLICCPRLTILVYNTQPSHY